MPEINTETASEPQPNGSSNGGWTAAYTSFATLISTADRMKEQGGAPSRVDRSYLSNLPGGAQTIFLSSCKSVGLIDDNLKPTPRFESFIDAAPSERKRLIGEMLREYYAGPLGLGERATQQQLEEEFRKLNVSGSTMRKAVGFFLNAAKFAGIAVSPNFKLPKAPANVSRKAPARRKDTPNEPEDENPPPPKSNLPTLVQGLVERLPKDGEEWSGDEANQWLKIAKLTFPFVYGFEFDSDAGGGGDSG